jgi:hypothetical protein
MHSCADATKQKSNAIPQRCASILKHWFALKRCKASMHRRAASGECFTDKRDERRSEEKESSVLSVDCGVLLRSCVLSPKRKMEMTSLKCKIQYGYDYVCRALYCMRTATVSRSCLVVSSYTVTPVDPIVHPLVAVTTLYITEIVTHYSSRPCGRSHGKHSMHQTARCH